MVIRRVNPRMVKEEVEILTFTADNRDAAKAIYPKLVALIKEFNKDQLMYFRKAFKVDTDDWSPTENWFVTGLDNGFYLIPMVGGRPAGMLNGEFSNDGGVKYLDINTVFVLPQYQRRGIGRTMFLQAKEMGKAEGREIIFLTVYANNPNAVKFYESVGLRPARINMVGNI